MRYALISDIHANLPALEAVLDEIGREYRDAAIYEDPAQEALSHLSYAWTREHVSPETKTFLGSLPFRIDIRPLGGHVSGPVDGIHFVNTGSVGRPKDGDPRAGYVVLEITGDSVNGELRRAEYDVERTATAILETDLPNEFADYLRSGGVKLISEIQATK